MLDANKLKEQFPIFRRKFNGKDLIYLDNASTTQKPQSVIDALKDFYENHNANIHRGVYTLSEESSEAYEETRQKTAQFINAKSSNEIIFTKNTTEAINLVAFTWGEENIQKGDEIIVSDLEHHSNLLPWKNLAEKKGANVISIPITKNYTLDMSEFDKALSKKTKLVAMSAMSNVLGTILPTEEITKKAHQIGAKVLIDGAQSAAHLSTDVQKIDCDFFCFSAHKMLGPTGVGILYAKENTLENLPPFLQGGGMVKAVLTNETIYSDIPQKFEAGTPNIADVVAFSKSLKFLEEVGMDNIAAHEKKLSELARYAFSKYSQVSLFSPFDDTANSSILSFTVEDAHPHDIATIFNADGIAIRAGHHCANPLMLKLGVNSTARISFYLYNTEKDIESADVALSNVIGQFCS